MYCYICKKQNPEITHHIFPKDPTSLRKWLNAFGLKKNDILKNTRVCGNHFNENCFHIVNAKSGRRTLIKGSVPTLLLPKGKSVKRKLMFNDGKVKSEKKLCLQTIDVITQEPGTSYYLEKSQEELALNNQCSPHNDETKLKPKPCSEEVEVINVTTQKQIASKNQKRWRPAYLNQIDMVEGFATPRRARKHFEMAVSKVNTLKKKVLKLNRSNRRLMKRIQHLEGLLKTSKNQQINNR